MGKKKRFILWTLLPVAATLLCACEGVPFTDQDFVAKIFPNGYWDFLIQLLAFVVLLVVVFFVGYKPVKNMLKKRQDGVNAMIEETKTNRDEAKKAALAKEQTIQEGKEEAERILSSARKQAEHERQELLAKAKEEAELQRKKAAEEIEAAKAASKEAVRKEIVDVAMLASSTLLGREVSSEDNKRLVEDFVESLNKDKDGEGK